MIVLKHDSGGLSRAAGNNHAGRTFERPSPSEITKHEAELALMLFAKKAHYRLILTADDIKRIAPYARLKAWNNKNSLPDGRGKVTLELTEGGLEVQSWLPARVFYYKVNGRPHPTNSSP